MSECTATVAGDDAADRFWPGVAVGAVAALQTCEWLGYVFGPPLPF